MPQYKLIYFDMPGRAESMRLMFKIAKVPFEDVRIAHNEWQDFKKKTPFGQLPILEVDGKQISQSRTILRFLGKRFNMIGQSEMDSVKCDEISDAVYDINEEVVKVVFGKDDATKEEAKKNVVEKVWPNYLPKLNQMAKSVPGDFIVGKSVSWCDVYVAHSLEFWEVVDKNVLKNYPDLKKVKEAVNSIPEVKDYLKARAIIDSKTKATD